MTIQRRQATRAEVAEYLRHNARVSFRHFVTESCRQKRGEWVTVHRQRSTAKVSVGKDGAQVASGKHKGEYLTGTFCQLPSGRTFVADIRIDSPYLPTNI